jgi:hypothetical protein
MTHFFNKILTKFLTLFGGYYDGHLYRFTHHDNTLKLIKVTDDFKPKLLIVSALYCQVSKQVLPLVDAREVRKALKLQASENDYHLVQNTTDTHTEVNIFSFGEKLPAAWIHLPEILLMANTIEQATVLEYEAENNLTAYVTHLNRVIFSGHQYGMIKDADLFAISIGLSFQQIEKISFKEKVHYLHNGLKHFNVLRLFLSLIKFNKHQGTAIVRKFLLTGISVVSIYFFLISSYLFFVNQSLDSASQNQANNIGEILSQKQTFESDLVKLQQLTSFVNSRASINGLWPVIAPLFEHAKFINIELKSKQLVLTGSTRSSTASALLAKIINNNNVHSAEFEIPVRTSKNTEYFKINVTLNSKFIELEKEVSSLG